MNTPHFLWGNTPTNLFWLNDKTPLIISAKVNTALLTKWLWCIGLEENAPRITLLIAKYNIGNASSEVELPPRKCSRMWRTISAFVDKFNQGIRLKVGWGNIVKF